MKRGFIRFLAITSAICITTLSVVYRAEKTPDNTISAKTLAEIEIEKKEKQAEIDAKKEELKRLATDISQKEAYQKSLNDQMELISDKMYLIDTQIQNVNLEIVEKQDELTQLDTDISSQQIAVDEGMALFKQRVRVMYIYGNDSLLSALVGATDFYEVLSKAEMIKRISKHDEDLINNLKNNIEKLTTLQQDKTTALQALNIKAAELESLRSEFADSRAELDIVAANTDSAKQILLEQHETVNEGLSLSQEEMDQLREEEEELILEVARQAAEEASRTATTTTTTTTTKRTTTTTTTTTTATTKPTTKKTTTTTSTTKKATTTTTATTKATTKAATASTTKKTTSTTTTATTKKTTASTTASTAPTTVSTTATSTTAKTTTASSSGKIDYQGGTFAWPVPGYYRISSPFGPRWGKIHKGIDIIGAGKAINGTNVYPCANGTVKIAKYGWNGGFGNYIQIDHGNGICTIYAHLSSISVSAGQKVQLGQKIGNVGSTGNSTGPHLHLGVVVNGNYVNPMHYLY